MIVVVDVMSYSKIYHGVINCAEKICEYIKTDESIGKYWYHIGPQAKCHWLLGWK